ncbi:hypothetical protein BDR05DRAFT_952097 [Suillus weaverae]|nr:hypothetical protein BDR05DRAFT_952097 [Suillus weaverae]
MGPPVSIGNNIPLGPPINIGDIHNIGPQSAGPSYTGYYFSLLNAQDTVKISKFQVTHCDLYTSTNQLPVKDGVLDHQLSPHIKLVVPVFHIGYFKHTIAILQAICKTCACVLLEEPDQQMYLENFQLLPCDQMTINMELQTFDLGEDTPYTCSTSYAPTFTRPSNSERAQSLPISYHRRSIPFTLYHSSYQWNFMAPHYLLLCHAQGLNVLPLISPPAAHPYALVHREVKKAIEWCMEVETWRERE